jgi:hypothetical protein
MSNPSTSVVVGQYLGEFIDSAPPRAGEVPRYGQADQPAVHAEYVDCAPRENAERTFTVLLRDRSVVTVRGYRLNYLPNTATSADPGSYAILSRTDGRETTVALFRVSEVTGIFSGEMRPGD